MFLPTSISAISIERISKAVPLFSPFSSTVLDIESGFSKTASYVSLEPIALTIPSPTLAIIVSSVAPPTRFGISVLTVTLALARTSIPSLATADNFPSIGASITFGYTLV